MVSEAAVAVRLEQRLVVLCACAEGSERCLRQTVTPLRREAEINGRKVQVPVLEPCQRYARHLGPCAPEQRAHEGPRVVMRLADARTWQGTCGRCGEVYAITVDVAGLSDPPGSDVHRHEPGEVVKGEEVSDG